jgi:hypothetical protein
MTYAVKWIPETWFGELPLQKCGIPEKRLPHGPGIERWPCVVDDVRRILFTFLATSSLEGRDNLHFSLLAIRCNVFTTSWRDGRKIVASRCIDEDDPDPISDMQLVVALDDEMSAILAQANSHPYKDIVNADGNAFRSE